MGVGEGGRERQMVEGAEKKKKAPRDQRPDGSSARASERARVRAYPARERPRARARAPTVAENYFSASLRRRWPPGIRIGFANIECGFLFADGEYRLILIFSPMSRLIPGMMNPRATL